MNVKQVPTRLFYKCHDFSLTLLDKYLRKYIFEDYQLGTDSHSATRVKSASEINQKVLLKLD